MKHEVLLGQFKGFGAINVPSLRSPGGCLGFRVKVLEGLGPRVYGPYVPLNTPKLRAHERGWFRCPTGAKIPTRRR